MDGLCGANCRHSYFAFVEGVSERTYTDEELANIDPPPFTFEGKQCGALVKKSNSMYNTGSEDGNVKPDIILYNPENASYAMFDIKYKDSTNSRFSRSDRMQVLAYGLMIDVEHIGNVFPTQDCTSNLYYIEATKSIATKLKRGSIIS